MRRRLSTMPPSSVTQHYFCLTFNSIVFKHEPYQRHTAELSNTCESVVIAMVKVQVFLQDFVSSAQLKVTVTFSDSWGVMNIVR